MSDGQTAKDIPLPRPARRRQDSYIRQVTRAPVANNAVAPEGYFVSPRGRRPTGPVPSTLSLASGRIDPIHRPGTAPGYSALTTARMRLVPPVDARPVVRPVARMSTIPAPAPLEAHSPRVIDRDAVPPSLVRNPRSPSYAIWSGQETTVRQAEPSKSAQVLDARARDVRPLGPSAELVPFVEDAPSQAAAAGAIEAHSARDEAWDDVLERLYAETEHERQLQRDAEALPTRPGYSSAKTAIEGDAIHHLPPRPGDARPGAYVDFSDPEESHERVCCTEVLDDRDLAALHIPVFANQQLDHAVRSYRASQEVQVDAICRTYPRAVVPGAGDVSTEPKNDPAAWHKLLRWDEVDTQVQPDGSRAELLVVTRQRELGEARRELVRSLSMLSGAARRANTAFAVFVRALFFSIFPGKGREGFTAAGGEGTEALAVHGSARVRPGTGS